MRRSLILLPIVLTLILFLQPPQRALTQGVTQLAACQECACSTEEDFLTRGPTPPDGNPLISDGDLLSCNGSVCMRNAQLLQIFDETNDLGLDAVDVLHVERALVAFSTELNSTHGIFTEGDLLTTWGAVIPCQALLIRFQVSGDRGLDAVQFVGKVDDILSFNEMAKSVSRSQWLREPGTLVTELNRYEIDIWFSIEGTERSASTVPIYDGDLLSAADGTIVVPNSGLLPATVPAGIPSRGVDFGLDAVAAPRDGFRQMIRFSTEILYQGEAAFSDGDILMIGNGIAISDRDLYAPFEPVAYSLGTDAFYAKLVRPAFWDDFLPYILKLYRGLRRDLSRP